MFCIKQKLHCNISIRQFQVPPHWLWRSSSQKKHAKISILQNSFYFLRFEASAHKKKKITLHKWSFAVLCCAKSKQNDENLFFSSFLFSSIFSANAKRSNTKIYSGIRGGGGRNENFDSVSIKKHSRCNKHSSL